MATQQICHMQRHVNRTLGVKYNHTSRSVINKYAIRVGELSPDYTISLLVWASLATNQQQRSTKRGCLQLATWHKCRVQLLSSVVKLWAVQVWHRSGTQCHYPYCTAIQTKRAIACNITGYTCIVVATRDKFIAIISLVALRGQIITVNSHPGLWGKCSRWVIWSRSLRV